MKLRVFRAPTSTNKNNAFIGIPDEIKLNAAISTISIAQTEILPTPMTLADTLKKPKIEVNPQINAFKNVQTTSLKAGFELTPSITTLPGFFLPPIEVEEVIIPEGFVHLDDISDWEIFNYNSSYTLADANFKLLPGEERVPREGQFDITMANSSIAAQWTSPVTSVHLYYQRISETVPDYEWTLWEVYDEESNRSIPFPYFGEYKLRAVPYFENYPLGGWKEYKIKIEETEELDWTYMQLSPDSFHVKLSGIVGTDVNHVDFVEDGTLLTSQVLDVDSKGRIDVTLTLSNVTTKEFPRIKLKFYRKYNAYKAFVFQQELLLEKNYAFEKVTLQVDKLTSGRYECTIRDPQGELYSPPSPIQPFTGANWVTAIETKALLAKLEIIRHQSGVATNYGNYYINTTSEITPNFISNPPFEPNIAKISDGFKFVFEDTLEFRDIANVDTPDTDKTLHYEFRLIYRSAGVDDSLRNRNEYTYIKEVPIFINNKRGSHKYSYNSYKLEHPLSKYRNITPLDVSKSFLDNHIRYGRSVYGILLEDVPQPVEKTYNIEIVNGQWKVLYYYADDDDEIQQFPYYCFDILVPASSQLTIESIQVLVENGSTDLNLGTFHPSNSISIVDWCGYYISNQAISKQVDFRKPINNFEANLPTSSVLPATTIAQVASLPSIIPSFPVNTLESKQANKKLVTKLNNEIGKKTKERTLKYFVRVNYEGEKQSLVIHEVNMATIPEITNEPENNISLSIGNKQITAASLQVSPSLETALVNTVKTVDTKQVKFEGMASTKSNFRGLIK